MSDNERKNIMTEEKWRELTAKASKGDNAAFEELYNESKRSVYFICTKMLSSEHDAKDAMQNTYITAYQKLSSLDDGANFLKWINGIAANKCREFFHGKAAESLDEKLEEGIEFTDEEFIPEEYVSDMERRRIIMNIIETELSDVQRQTVILYYYNQLTVSQIADEMSCPENTVKYRLCAARDKIKEAVLIYEKEHDDRLHAIMPIPVLTRIFRTEAEQISVPDIPLHLPKKVSAPAKTILKNAGGSKIKNALLGKIIAGVAAVGVIGGGIAAVVVHNSNDNDSKTDSTVSVISTDSGSSSSVNDTQSDSDTAAENSGSEKKTDIITRLTDYFDPSKSDPNKNLTLYKSDNVPLTDDEINNDLENAVDRDIVQGVGRRSDYYLTSDTSIQRNLFQRGEGDISEFELVKNALGDPDAIYELETTMETSERKIVDCYALWYYKEQNFIGVMNVTCYPDGVDVKDMSIDEFKVTNIIRTEYSGETKFNFELNNYIEQFSKDGYTLTGTGLETLKTEGSADSSANENSEEYENAKKLYENLKSCEVDCLALSVCDLRQIPSVESHYNIKLDDYDKETQMALIFKGYLTNYTTTVNHRLVDKAGNTVPMESATGRISYYNKPDSNASNDRTFILQEIEAVGEYKAEDLAMRFEVIGYENEFYVDVPLKVTGFSDYEDLGFKDEIASVISAPGKYVKTAHIVNYNGKHYLAIVDDDNTSYKTVDDYNGKGRANVKSFRLKFYPLEGGIKDKSIVDTIDQPVVKGDGKWIAAVTHKSDAFDSDTNRSITFEIACLLGPDEAAPEKEDFIRDDYYLEFPDGNGGTSRLNLLSYN